MDYSVLRVAVIAVLLAFSSGSAVLASEEEEEWVGKPAPEFSLTDLGGASLELSQLVGKKVVWLNFWGLRCGPCVRELPALQKLYAQYQERGLLIVGVNADGVDAAFIQKQLADRADLKAAGVTFPLTPDADFAVIDQYGLMGAPLNVIIDKKGIVRFRHEGYEDGDEAHYAEVVEQLLAE